MENKGCINYVVMRNGHVLFAREIVGIQDWFKTKETLKLMLEQYYFAGEGDYETLKYNFDDNKQTEEEAMSIEEVYEMLDSSDGPLFTATMEREDGLVRILTALLEPADAETNKA